MKPRLLVLASLLLLFVAGCGTVQTPQELESQKVQTRLAVLRGSTTYPTANGKATYKVDNNGIREFGTEIQDVRALAGRTVNVFVGIRKVGSMTLDAFGDGNLDLVGAAAPAISPTSTPVIRVRTSAGVLVASGRMNQIR